MSIVLMSNEKIIGILPASPNQMAVYFPPEGSEAEPKKLPVIGHLVYQNTETHEVLYEPLVNYDFVPEAQWDQGTKWGLSVEPDPQAEAIKAGFDRLAAAILDAIKGTASPALGADL